MPDNPIFLSWKYSTVLDQTFKNISDAACNNTYGKSVKMINTEEKYWKETKEKSTRNDLLSAVLWSIY